MIISNSDNEKLVMNTIMATTATTVALIITTIIKITMKKKLNLFILYPKMFFCQTYWTYRKTSICY